MSKKVSEVVFFLLCTTPLPSTVKCRLQQLKLAMNGMEKFSFLCYFVVGSNKYCKIRWK